MEERIDLTALNLDEGRRELLVAAIMANAAPELARRAAAVDVSPLLFLTRWSRPALAAAAVLAMICVSVLSMERDQPVGPAYGIADALAVPEPADAWLVGGRAPTVGDVLLAMEREGR
ncbi:hypothetical protein BH23GEM9_BH23GEM9_34710 [soil metagenome]